MGYKVKKIYVGTNLVRPKPQDITETISLTPGAEPHIGKTGYTIQSIVIEGDYYNPSSGWTGSGYKISNSSTNIGYYIWGGNNNSSYPNSDGKIETGSTLIYNLPYKYMSGGNTYRVKAIFTREYTSFTVGSNPEEKYFYSSGSYGPTFISIMDNADVKIHFWASSGGASLSNGTATITYIQN